MAKEIIPTSLNEMERAFVRRLAEIGDPRTAILDAGYLGERPDRAANNLLATPHILKAVQTAVRGRLVNEGPNSIRVLVELRDNPEISPKVRADCAKTLLDRAGHVAPRATIDRNQTDKPLHELSTDELRAMADRLEGELAERAKPVISAAPAPIETNETDLIG
jgi:hypothetical protein